MTIKAMSDKDYFADPAIDQSGLKQWMISPAKYVASLEQPEDNPVLRLGSLIHAHVLGTDVEDYVAKPEMRTKIGKAKASELMEQGKTLVPQDDLILSGNMAEVTSPLFDHAQGKAEQAIFEDYKGLTLKGKYDWLPSEPDDDGVLRIVDYKTTADATEFAYHAWKYGYHIQAAYYMMLCRLEGYDGFLGFRFIAQEKTAPYDYMVYDTDEQQPEIRLASQRISKALSEMAAMGVGASGWKDKVAKAGYDHKPRELRFSDWQLANEDAKAEPAF